MVLQYRVMHVVYYLLCQILIDTLMLAMQGIKIHGGALQDTRLRSVVVQSSGRVECKRPYHYLVWSRNTWQLVQQHKKLYG